MFNPQQYWNINDIRIDYLVNFLGLCKFNLLEDYSDKDIIQKCINTIAKNPLSEEEKIKLKDTMNANQVDTYSFFAEKFCGELEASATMQLVSLGCGNRGLFEEILDTKIREMFPTMHVNWLGLDVGDYRDKDSFFNNHEFVVIPSNAQVYSEYIQEKNIDAILVGVYSFHHIGIDFSEFLIRCNGFKKVCLVEEPTTTELWKKNDYRIMRIAFDVLANTVFVLDWAEEFIKNPDVFMVNYIREDLLPSDSKLVHVVNHIPETALVIV